MTVFIKATQSSKNTVEATSECVGTSGWIPGIRLMVKSALSL